MESWLENFRPASFRGIPFFILSSSLSAGRRVALHEFPNRNTSFPEDMGKVSTVYQIEGHIVGDDYFERKDNLVRAMEQESFGELVHPYYGTLQVQPGIFTVNENTRDGRTATFSMQFFKAEFNEFPTEDIDKTSTVFSRTAATIDSSIQDFNSKFSTERTPADLVRSARAKVQQLTRLIRSSVDGVTTLANNTADLFVEIDNLDNDVDELLSSPAFLADRINNSFMFMFESIESIPDKALQLLRYREIDVGDFDIPLTTTLRIQENINRNSMNFFIKTLALSYLARAAVTEVFDSIDSATARRNEVRDFIEELLNETDNDDLFQSLVQLNAAIVSAIPDEDVVLPNIKTLDTVVTTNSLVLNYQIYGNLDGESDIISRNLIKNPAFILGQTEIEYIEDV